MNDGDLVLSIKEGRQSCSRGGDEQTMNANKAATTLSIGAGEGLRLGHERWESQLALIARE